MTASNALNWSLICAGFVTCASSCTSTPAPAALSQPAALSAPAKLEGAWISTAIQARAHSTCPWIIELFEDGTLDTNYLSDDRGAVCMFSRLPYRHDPKHQPPLLEVGGQLSRCIYQLDGDRLRLACEDHGKIPTGDVEWLEFHRLEVREGEGLEDLAGAWLPPSFWGSADPWIIDPQGALTIGGEAGTIELDGRDRLVLRLGRLVQRCLYRVTAHRLALRCVPEAERWPEQLSTVATVLYRLPK